MISWRYHLVSIVAVFLALALGVLAGTAVVNQNLVKSLKHTTDSLRKENADYQSKITDLTGQLGPLTDFSDQAMPAIVSLQLSQVDVVLVSDDTADPRALAEIKGALSMAGANVVTTLVPLPKLYSTNPADVKALAAIVGAPAQTTSSQLPALVASTLAARLASGPPPARPGQQDVLASLLSGGFIDSRDPGVKTAGAIGIPGAVIVVGGPAVTGGTSPATFLVPLVRSLSVQGTIVVAGEGRPTPGGFVDQVKGLPTGVGLRLTVNDLDSALGATALIVGLRRAIDQGTGGDYGIISGQLVMPPLT